tara:strand:+ start:8875 stop:9273 length:399 start_codon:yes stop_codon:yes gene_type:complete
MYEVTTQELMIFVVMGFACGLFASIFLARFFEVIHTWRIVESTVGYLLLMCAKIVEDLAFLSEVKRKHMQQADFTHEQIRKFEEVDERTLTNWKDSVVLGLVRRAPPHFKSMLRFKNWNEAMRFMNNTFKGE